MMQSIIMSCRTSPALPAKPAQISHTKQRTESSFAQHAFSVLADPSRHMSAASAAVMIDDADGADVGEGEARRIIDEALEERDDESVSNETGEDEAEEDEDASVVAADVCE